jgi:hypothetical protein
MALGLFGQYEKCRRIELAVWGPTAPAAGHGDAGWPTVPSRTGKWESQLPGMPTLWELAGKPPVVTDIIFVLNR